MPSTTTSADGHIAVTTLAQTDGAQRWIGVSIVDSGPGFSPTDQLHLFEQFYRGDAVRDYKTTGAGRTVLGGELGRAGRSREPVAGVGRLWH